MHQKNLSIIELIEQGESLCLEFKSDIKSLPDRELIAALVALTNTEGGSLLLGVEDDGRVTGLHPNHIAIQRLPALVANKTNPPISIKIITHQVQDHILAQIIVPKSRYLVSLVPRMLTGSRMAALCRCPACHAPVLPWWCLLSRDQGAASGIQDATDKT